MRKISTAQTNNILLKYILKVIFSTFVSIILFSYISAQIVYRFDLDMKADMILSVFICAFSAAVISVASVSGMRNNGLIAGALSQIPLLFYSLLNVIFNENTLLFFLIKSVIIICVGMLTGIIASKRTANRTRIK